MRQRAAPRVIAHRLVVLDIAIGPIARPAHVVLDIIFVFVFILFVVRRAAVREAVGAVIVISAGVIRAHHAAALKQPHAASAQLLVNRLVRCLQRLDHGVAFCAFRHGARVLQLPVGDVDVHGVLVVHEPADVRHRRVQAALLLVQRSLPDRVGQRAWVRQHVQLRQVEVADAGDVHTRVRAHVRAAQPAVHRDVAVTLWRRSHCLARRVVLEAVAEHVGVRQPPRQRPRLDDRDEAREIEDLALEVAPMLDARQVEELGAVVDLGPEARLELLLRLL
mmetsp:Transcript_11845/g.34960  ORF Transcript_11845/g.34960 Transcript_11845/m.34960 type:complete len:278 (-) Transcript_11845:404-1237(-)